MKTGTKVGIGIGAVAAIVGGYFLWKNVIKPKREAKKAEETKNPSEVSNAIANAPTSSKSGGGSSSSSSSSSSGSSVPFKNKEEGNHFRNWVNDNFPDYAAKLKGDGLDRDGSYNNSHMRQAWKDKGEAYQKAIKDAKAAEEKKAAEIKVGDWTMTNKSSLNSTRQQTYSRPTVSSADYKGRVTGIPKNVKFQVKRIARDSTNGKKMCAIFNSGYKFNQWYTQGTGFKVYCSYLKKVDFYEDFDGLDGYSY